MRDPNTAAVGNATPEEWSSFYNDQRQKEKRRLRDLAERRKESNGDIDDADRECDPEDLIIE